MQSIRSLARRLPDIPRWVEIRYYLLEGEGTILWLDDGPELSLIIHDDATASVFVVGRPPLPAVTDAIEGELKGGIIVPQEETAEWLSSTLRGWTRRKMLLHLLRHPDRLPVDAEEVVGFLDPSILRRLGLPSELLGELEVGAGRSPIAATFVAGEPVSFCYAGSRTESLWDVSIDTLPEHRRRGYAALCAAWMIRHMEKLGRKPVWAALEENLASWRLALRLGFERVDAIAIFERG